MPLSRLPQDKDSLLAVALSRGPRKNWLHSHRYRLYDVQGGEQGSLTLAYPIVAGDAVDAKNGRHAHVIEVVQVDDGSADSVVLVRLDDVDHQSSS